jgi:dTDP-4-amino-4,6-dideoxygalactose transaminase
MPVRHHDAYRDLGYSRGNLPRPEQPSREILSLRVYPELAEQEVRCICSDIGGFYADVDNGTI